VTVAVALTCAHTVCGAVAQIIISALTIVNIVLIPNEYSRTMPVNCAIFLKYLFSNYIVSNDLRQIENWQYWFGSYLVGNFYNGTTYSFVQKFTNND
jgi:hypothetical protein